MTAAVSSAFNDWVVRPSRFNEATEDLLTSGPGLKDVLEACGTALEWVPYFDVSKGTVDFATKVGGELDPVCQGLAAISFFSDLNVFRRSLTHYFSSDDGDSGRKVFTSAMSAVNSGSETAMFLDTIDVAPLKDGMKAVSGAFWGSAILLSGVDYFYQTGQAEQLQKEIKNENDTEIKAVRQDELGLTYLKILKNITTVALASLILVSLVFAGASAYLLFSPVVQLGLSTAWFVLHFVNHYYSSMIDWEKDHLAKLGKKA